MNDGRDIATPASDLFAENANYFAMAELLASVVLVMMHSAPLRRAFIAGYNGYAAPTPCTLAMAIDYALGRKVGTLVHETLRSRPEAGCAPAGDASHV